jgi:transposase
MPGQRLPMRKIRDVLRLSAAGMSKRKIAASLGVSATAAGECLRRARRVGLGWPLPEGMTDAALESGLYPRPATTAKDRRPPPDWPAIHRELRRAGVTLQLLWEEHRAAHPAGYGYSRFCELYRAWEGRLSPTMRQTHVAGERLFVDYAGTTMEVIDGTTGGVITAQLFVAALGASNYTYAEATRTQGLGDWIGSHTRAFDFFGGVPAMVVSDNLKSGVTKACFYEPAVNRTYAEMAAHYDTAVVPARPYKPRDKAKVEVAVQVATRWIVARLRHRRFFSLAELNEAIAELVTALNNRVTRHLGASRREAVRGVGAIGPQEAAGRALRLRRMEGMPSRARLSRRGRAALLLRPAHAAARDDVGAHHRPHGRGVPSRQARRRACALVIGPEAHDGARAHAVEPPALRRLDAGAPPAAGRRDRPQDLGTGRDHPARADASRAGVPRLDRHSATRQELWP